MTTTAHAVRGESFLRSLGAGAIWRGLDTLSSLAKHVIIAGAIGLSAQLDVFYMANALMAVFVFSLGQVVGAMAQPRLITLWKSGDRTGFERLGGGLLGLSLLVSVALAALVYMLSGPLSLLAPGFEPERRALLEEALRWLTPVIVFYAPFCCLGSLYRATRQASTYSQAQFFITVAIMALVAAFPYQPQVLLWSYSVGMLIGFSYLLLRALRWMRVWQAPWSPEVRASLQEGPLLLLLAASAQIYQLTDRAFQSCLPAGAIGALSYAWVLVSFAPALLMFNNGFMAAFAERRHAGESGAPMLDQLVSLTLLVGVPLMGVLLAFGTELIRLLLERGGFTGHSTALTALALAGYVPGLLAVLLMPPLKQVFQVQGRNGVLLGRIAAGLVVNVALNSLFVLYWGWGVLGISLAFALSQLVMLATALHFLHREGIRLSWKAHAGWACYMALGTGLAVALAKAGAWLGSPPWLVLPQLLIVALAVGGWAFVGPGPAGALVRATARRCWPLRRAALAPSPVGD